MKLIRNMLNTVSPLFEDGDKLRAMRPVYEAADHFFFSHVEETTCAPYGRDPIDIKPYMTMVIVALMPAFLASLWFFGPRVLLLLAVSYVAGGMVEVISAIIATFVIVFDQFLKAFYWDMSRQLGPYVGLIITNCIVMGRAEAFATQNPPLLSIVDGVANGIGYMIILALIAVFRELLGAGTLLGYTVLSTSWYEPNVLMVLAPGAFFTAGFLIWIINALRGK